MINNQSINRTIGLVNVRHSFQGKTAIKRDTNKPEQLIEIWGPFLKSPETFPADLGLHKSHSILRTELGLRFKSPNFKVIMFCEDLKRYFKSDLLKQLDSVSQIALRA